MKKILLILALTAAAAVPAAGQIVTPYYNYFGQNKIVYDRFDWQTYKSTHFTIYFYDREQVSLQKVASYAESAYDEISRALNFQIPKSINIIYYSTHSEFEQTNTLGSFIPEGIGAFALPTRNRMVLPVDLPDEKLQKLIAHELTHVFQFEILFGGSFIRAYTSGAPQWLTEGMASYFANDEDSKDHMVLRDAVLADQVPEIAERGIYGFFAYRFGHAVFDYIEAEWGRDGVRDFVFEFRGALGPSIERTLRHTFDVSPEDFDVRFRRYLRQKYIKILTEKGEPIDFGDRVRLGDVETAELSVRAFPSGDLGAAISTLGEDANVVIFSPRERKLFKNLTKGYKTRYEYIVAQWLTTGPVGGVDLSVSPDGNIVALFVRRERGRELLLLNALDGQIDEMIPMPGLDQQLNPSFSPDGRTIVFRALKNGRSDIYAYNRDAKTPREPDRRRVVRLRADLLARRPVALLLLGPGHHGQDLPDSAGRRRLARADHLRQLERRGRVALPGRQAPLLHLRPRRRHLQHLFGQPRDGRDLPAHQRGRRLLLAERPARPRRVRAAGVLGVLQAAVHDLRQRLEEAVPKARGAQPRALPARARPRSLRTSPPSRSRSIPRRSPRSPAASSSWRTRRSSRAWAPIRRF